MKFQIKIAHGIYKNFRCYAYAKRNSTGAIIGTGTILTSTSASISSSSSTNASCRLPTTTHMSKTYSASSGSSNCGMGNSNNTHLGFVTNQQQQQLQHQHQHQQLQYYRSYSSSSSSSIADGNSKLTRYNRIPFHKRQHLNSALFTTIAAAAASVGYLNTSNDIGSNDSIENNSSSSSSRIRSNSNTTNFITKNSKNQNGGDATTFYFSTKNYTNTGGIFSYSASDTIPNQRFVLSFNFVFFLNCLRVTVTLFSRESYIKKFAMIYLYIFL